MPRVYTRKPCLVCNGSGTIQREVVIPTGATFIASLHTVTVACRKCIGTGNVQRPAVCHDSKLRQANDDTA